MAPMESTLPSPPAPSRLTSSTADCKSSSACSCALENTARAMSLVLTLPVSVQKKRALEHARTHSWSACRNMTSLIVSISLLNIASCFLSEYRSTIMSGTVLTSVAATVGSDWNLLMSGSSSFCSSSVTFCFAIICSFFLSFVCCARDVGRITAALTAHRKVIARSRMALAFCSARWPSPPVPNNAAGTSRFNQSTISAQSLRLSSFSDSDEITKCTICSGSGSFGWPLASASDLSVVSTPVISYSWLENVALVFVVDFDFEPLAFFAVLAFFPCLPPAPVAPTVPDVLQISATTSSPRASTASFPIFFTIPAASSAAATRSRSLGSLSRLKTLRPLALPSTPFCTSTVTSSVPTTAT